MKFRNYKVICIALALAAALFLAGCAQLLEAAGVPAQPAHTAPVYGELTEYVEPEESPAPTASLPNTAELSEYVEPAPEQTPPPAGAQAEALDENGAYASRDDVALYIHTYGHLPGNFITKDEARQMGWEGGSLERYAPGKSIGGDRFGNYEGRLPKAKGRTYTECDIGTPGESSRGARRIVFSNDGLIYYTADHYESFTLLYGEE